MEKYQPKYSMSYYLSHPWLRHLLKDERTQDILLRVVKFMDETGLKPSNRRLLGYKCDNILKLGFDHTVLWYKNRKHIYTTEPYRDHSHVLENSLKRQNVPYKILENSLWNPPKTKLYLIQIPTQLKLSEVNYGLETFSR